MFQFLSFVIHGQRARNLALKMSAKAFAIFVCVIVLVVALSVQNNGLYKTKIVSPDTISSVNVIVEDKISEQIEFLKETLVNNLKSQQDGIEKQLKDVMNNLKYSLDGIKVQQNEFITQLNSDGTLLKQLKSEFQISKQSVSEISEKLKNSVEKSAENQESNFVISQKCDIAKCGNSEYAYSKPKQGIMIGDSITAFAKQENGFQWLLQNRLNETKNLPRITVLNRGFSGQNTNYLLRNIENKLFPESIKQNLTDVVFSTIMMGANDASNRGQHVDVDVYGENLKQVMIYVNASLKVPFRNQIVISMPPFDSSRIRDGSRYNSQTVEFVAESRRLADELGARFLPLYDIMRMKGETLEGEVLWKSYLKDGLHLSDSGNKLVFDELWDNHLPCILC